MVQLHANHHDDINTLFPLIVMLAAIGKPGRRQQKKTAVVVDDGWTATSRCSYCCVGSASPRFCIVEKEEKDGEGRGSFI